MNYRFFRFTVLAAALLGGVVLPCEALADTASGLPTGKRQHKPFHIRPQVARALESGRYEQAQKFTLFKPDGTPLRAQAKPSAEGGKQSAKVTVRGWDPKKKAMKGESRTRPFRRLTCKGEQACVQMIAVDKACAPRTVKCTDRSCSCRSRS